jgi:hypothetical protein
MGTANADRIDLRNWAIEQCGLVPANTDTVAAGMELPVGGGVNAGGSNNLAGNFDLAEAIQVETREAGTRSAGRESGCLPGFITSEELLFAGNIMLRTMEVWSSSPAS